MVSKGKQIERIFNTNIATARHYLNILNVFLLLQVLIPSSVGLNLTNFIELRQKRSLIYVGGGSIKFSVSGVWPVYLEDHVNWRKLNCISGLSTVYKLPKKPTNQWEKWELPYGRSLEATRVEFDRTGYYKADPSRMFVYAALEEFMNRNNRNGRHCLLRSICENAQIDEHITVYSKILDVILTPANVDLDEIYENAFKAGKFGADCLTAYPKCPYGDSFMDRVAVVT